MLEHISHSNRVQEYVPSSTFQQELSDLAKIMPHEDSTKESMDRDPISKECRKACKNLWITMTLIDDSYKVMFGDIVLWSLSKNLSSDKIDDAFVALLVNNGACVITAPESQKNNKNGLKQETSTNEGTIIPASEERNEFILSKLSCDQTKLNNMPLAWFFTKNIILHHINILAKDGYVDNNRLFSLLQQALKFPNGLLRNDGETDELLVEGWLTSFLKTYMANAFLSAHNEYLEIPKANTSPYVDILKELDPNLSLSTTITLDDINNCFVNIVFRVKKVSDDVVELSLYNKKSEYLSFFSWSLKKKDNVVSWEAVAQ